MIKPYYQDEWVTIYNGDCREILPELPKVDLVLTDPPYSDNIHEFDYSNGRTWVKSSSGRNKLHDITHWELPESLSFKPDKRIIDLIINSANYSIIFGGHYFTDILPVSTSWLIWDKDNSGCFSDCEMAWTNLPGSVRRIIWRWNGMLQQDMSNKEKRVHPNQKPTPVIKWAIVQADKKAKVNMELILDPFMGSGTTLLASKLSNRKSIGIEISEKYCDIAIKRLQQTVMNFEPVKEKSKQGVLMS